MEILSIIKGIEILKEPCFVTVYLNNQNLIDTYQKGWIERWVEKGLLLGNSTKVKNKDLHLKLLRLMKKHHVNLVRYDTLLTNSRQRKRAKTLALEQTMRTDLLPDMIRPVDKLGLEFNFCESPKDDG